MGPGASPAQRAALARRGSFDRSRGRGQWVKSPGFVTFETCKFRASVSPSTAARAGLSAAKLVNGIEQLLRFLSDCLTFRLEVLFRHPLHVNELWPKEAVGKFPMNVYRNYLAVYPRSAVL